MPDPVLTLESALLVVSPGGQVSVPVTITSTSTIVEGFTLDIVGSVVTRWAEVVPPVVDIYPGEAVTAVVVLSPPAGSKAHSGSFPFGVRARSTESAENSAVVEGDVEVGRVAGLESKLVPVTSVGRWRGQHTVLVTNSGNSAARLRMVATNPDQALGFYIHPELVDLEAGQSATVRMTVRTSHPFLRGPQVRLPFQVVGEPVDAPASAADSTPYDDPSRPVVDGALQQKPILTKPAVALMVAVVVLALGGGIWAWMNPLAPAVALESLGPPEKPSGVVAAALGPNRIRLGWAPIPQVTGYKVLGIDPSDRTSVNQTDPVDSSQNVFVLAKLAAATNYCYAVVAERGSLPSPRSDVACATTPAKRASGPIKPTPAKSETAAATASAPESSKAAGPPGPSMSVTQSTLETTAPTPTPVAPTTVYATVTLPPPPAVTETFIPPATDTWVVAGVYPKDGDPDGPATLKANLIDHGVDDADIETIDTELTPDVTIGGAPAPELTLVIAIGPYTQSAQLIDACVKVQAAGSDEPSRCELLLKS